MESALSVVVPTVVVYIMTVVGLGLTVADFRRVARAAWVVVGAMLAQTVLLPLMAVGLALLLAPPAYLAVGMIVIAASPPAAMANFYVDMGGWNTPLSVTLTAVSNVLTPFLLPLVLSLSLPLVSGSDPVPHLPALPMVGQIVATMIVPLILGMAVRARWPSMRSALPRLRQLSLAGVLVVATLVTIAGAKVVRTQAAWLLGLSVLFTALALFLGLATGAVMRRPSRDRLTLSIDFSVRNGGIAIFITTSLLSNVEAAVFAVGVFIVQTPLALLLASRFRHASEQSAVAPST